MNLFQRLADLFLIYYRYFYNLGGLGILCWYTFLLVYAFVTYKLDSEVLAYLGLTIGAIIIPPIQVGLVFDRKTKK